MKDLLHGSLRGHLSPFGVDWLTGEAEGVRGLGRGRCDLTTKGKRLMEEFLGCQVEFRQGANFNSGKKDDPNVATAMLSMGLIRDFIIFAHASEGRVVYDGHLKPGCKGSFGREHMLAAWESEDEVEAWLNEYDGHRTSWGEYSWTKVYVDGTAGTLNRPVIQ